ncbi:hypothetical protein KDN24_06430 [Bacillus sp. Bva_UNVM-123]|uniref:hypothetical protein n=1 Tax=Bacillus sp. Bva_UNVM-123 TaxID=2829798 RepID=UPI00391EF341
MDIEQVIKIGQEISKPNFPWYSEFTFGLWSFILFAIFIGIALILWGYSDLGIGRGIIGVFLFFISFIVFMGTVSKAWVKEDEIFNIKVIEWENEYVKPFIESLPKQKKEIIYIKIDPELSHEVTGQAWWGTGYTRSTAVERTPLTVSYKDKGIVTKTSWYEAYMELTDEEKPYVEYQYLEKDLGHGIKKGIYNTKVHLPESYTFTDIK